MDVRCERCKTDYEFDDARITEAGVTVKCTTCGHIFKVKKKALVFTVPLKEGEPSQAPVPAGAPGSLGPQREWKVRQANGNVFTFKELTTLQKWIVERKVSRDDEISLTGESWKRLGNIAELASFFQVVDEAQKAAQLSAMQSQSALGLGQSMTPSGGGFPMVGAPAPTPPQPQPIYPLQQPVAAPPPPPPQVVVQVQHPPERPSQVAAANVREPAFAKSYPRVDDDELERAALGKKKGGAGKWIALLLFFVALGAGGYYGYFYYWLPMQQEEKAKQEAEEKARADAEAKAKADREAADAKAKADAEAKAKAEAAAREAALDAGVATVVDAGVAVAKKEPVHDFDYWYAQGERLREHDNPKAALDAYGKAADLKPDSVEPIAGRGLALLDLGMYPQAEAAFDTALKLNPRYGDALMGAAEAQRKMGNNKKAIEYFQAYLDAHPEGVDANAAKNAIEKLKGSE